MLETASRAENAKTEVDSAIEEARAAKVAAERAATRAENALREAKKVKV